MKLLTFKIHTEERLGAYIGDQIIDLHSAYTLILDRIEKKASAKRWASAIVPPSLKEFLEGGDESIKAAKHTLSRIRKDKQNFETGLDGEKIFFNRKDVRLYAPIPRPGKIYCLAANYYDHATERIKDPIKRNREIERLKNLNLDTPHVFQKPSSLVCGYGEPLIKPRNSDKMDYECELAVIIGKRGKYIPKKEAYKYIGGYTILIDVSFRDQGFPTDIPWGLYQRGINWTKMKGMDNAAPMGPCLVTKDDIPDPYSPPLRLITRVNGEVRQNNDLSYMIIKIPRLIEYLSDGITLEPGDVIATGTVSGVSRSWNSYLNVGDVIECEIQPIGVLKHTVIGD